MEDLKKAVDAVNTARVARDNAKLRFDEAEKAYDLAVSAAKEVHANVMKWLTEAVPGIGATRREL